MFDRPRESSSLLVAVLAAVCVLVPISAATGGFGLGTTQAHATSYDTNLSTTADVVLAEKGIALKQYDAIGAGFVSVTGTYVGPTKMIVRLVRLEPGEVIENLSSLAYEGVESRVSPTWDKYDVGKNFVVLSRESERISNDQQFEIRWYVPSNDTAEYHVEVSEVEDDVSTWLASVPPFTAYGTPAI